MTRIARALLRDAIDMTVGLVTLAGVAFTWHRFLNGQGDQCPCGGCGWEDEEVER